MEIICRILQQHPLSSIKTTRQQDNKTRHQDNKTICPLKTRLVVPKNVLLSKNRLVVLLS